MAEWIRKIRPLYADTMKVCENAGVTYLTFPALTNTGLVNHAFSTRLGGVSEGPYATMNFSFTRGDDPEKVRQNYLLMARAAGFDENSFVTSFQTHTTNLRVVTSEDRGKGVTRERDYTDIDGLMTNEKGITLCAFFADCVPLYFLDPVNCAIALSHSGWRGTVSRMGAVTLSAMRKEYGTDPKDVIACIGPSICRDCYEVGEDVIDRFRKEFSPDLQNELYDVKGNGKYQLDLWAANRIVLTEAGVLPENIHVTDICTHCNPGLLFSHRAAGEKRGNLAAFLCLI